MKQETIESLKKEIADLKKRITVLEMRQPMINHYHYTQPPIQYPPDYPYPIWSGGFPQSSPLPVVEG